MHHNLPMGKEMNLTTKNKSELKNHTSMQTDEIGQIDGVVIKFWATLEKYNANSKIFCKTDIIPLCNSSIHIGYIN